MNYIKMKKTTSDHDTLLEFPCAFPVKVMGYNRTEFSDAVWEIIQRHVPETKRTEFSERLSRNEKYLALSITITAQSKAQLDEIYQDLTAHDQVVMAL